MNDLPARQQSHEHINRASPTRMLPSLEHSWALIDFRRHAEYDYLALFLVHPNLAAEARVGPAGDSGGGRARCPFTSGGYISRFEHAPILVS